MTICFYFPSLANDQNNAIFGSMYESFFNELRKQGYNVLFTTNLSEIMGDILVTSIGSGCEKTAAKAMFRFNGPVILSVYNSYICFYRSFLKRWRKRFLFAYNPDYAKLNFDKYHSVGIPYFALPFASDPNIFKPLNTPKIYDVTFLGNGNSGAGREKYIQRLVDYAQKNNLNIFLAGTGWDKYGFPYRIVKHGEETNTIYNQTKVCINIHNDRQFAGEEIEMDANNRLFDLAMAGCCQVTNGEQMISKYFSTNEVASADSPEKWIDRINQLLINTEERVKMGENARLRALTDHTWEIRATEFISYINLTYPSYQGRQQEVNPITLLLRKADQYIMPFYLIKEIKVIKFILIKLGMYTKK